MPKPYTVTPRIPPGRKGYVATLYNSHGERITRSLETENLDKAKSLCLGFVALRNSGVRTIDQALALEVFVDPDCFPIYFSAAELDANEHATEVPASAAQLAGYLNVGKMRVEFSKDNSDKIKNTRAAVKSLRTHVGRLKADLDLERTERAKEQRTTWAHAARAAGNAPAIEVAAAEYETHVRSKMDRSNAGGHVNALKKFRSTLPPDLTNVADIRVEQIGAFLDARAAAGNPARQVGRRRAWHLLIARFFSFLQERYSLPSPMTRIPFPSKSEVERERGDIEWHTREEIEAAIANLPDDYWRALVGCLAYAGLPPWGDGTPFSSNCRAISLQPTSFRR